MALNRGPEWLPTDGLPDKRPFLRCTACRQLASCYRGPLIEVIKAPQFGEFRIYQWLCSSCFAAIVGEAIRQAENPST